MSIVIAILGWALSSALEAKGRIKGEFDSFVAQVKVTGEAAQKEADRKTKADKEAKEKTDAKTKKDLAALRAANKRLRNAASARGSILPAASASAASPDRATLDRAEFERAYRELVEEVRGIGEEGDEARLKLNSAREWAQGQ
ncbi:hypothetical protein HY346_00875 [Candidatus Microgenomates bacterium]|nr:hypothetical protein [Candidatus Microgenomates bacterium]